MIIKPGNKTTVNILEELETQSRILMHKWVTDSEKNTQQSVKINCEEGQQVKEGS